jgi:3-hydroxyisobutyrate dehydrogenase
MTSDQRTPRVAFLGLGIMGTGMARRLLAAGFPLTVYNRSAERARAVAADGAEIADSPRAAAHRADLVFSMVSDDAASRAMWEGDHGALGGARPGSVLVECSTVSVERARELAAGAERARCSFVDAPVTGSRAQAAGGELVFLVGAADADLARIRPALEAMSRSIVHLGPVGSGALVKLVNNFLGGVQAASLAEALAIIERSPLDRDRTLDVLVNGAPGSPIVKTLVSRIRAGDFTPNFYLHLLAKDVRYAIGEGERAGVPMTTGAAALEVLQRAIAHGDGDRDMAAVVEQFRETEPAR